MRTESGYDSYGEVTSVSQGGATSNFTYDTFGDLASSTSGTGVTTSFNYDNNANQTSSSFNWVNPNNSSDIRTVTTAAVFDGNDRSTQTTDQYGHNATTTYDAKGRVSQSTDVLGNTTKYIYNSADQVIETDYPPDPNYPNQGTLSRSVYDADGRVIYSEDPHVPSQSDIRGTHTESGTLLIFLRRSCP